MLGLLSNPHTFTRVFPTHPHCICLFPCLRQFSVFSSPYHSILPSASCSREEKPFWSPWLAQSLLLQVHRTVYLFLGLVTDAILHLFVRPSVPLYILHWIISSMKAEANVFFCSILSPAPNTVPDRDYVLSFVKGRTEGKRVERKDGKKREGGKKKGRRQVSFFSTVANSHLENWVRLWVPYFETKTNQSIFKRQKPKKGEAKLGIQLSPFLVVKGSYFKEKYDVLFHDVKQFTPFVFCK